MYRLLLSDRDKEELQGIQWFISKYSLPITTIETAEDLTSAVDDLENGSPDIVCFELDMVPNDKWEVIKPYIQNFSKQVIAITAEATFERTMQAMDVQAVDVWVKPISPSRVKQALQQALKNITIFSEGENSSSLRHKVSYESLFIEDQQPFPYAVYLLKTEFAADLPHLRKFIDQFDFYHTPSMFSMSDRIVLVFHHEMIESVRQAKRFLREWERTFVSPLTVAVHSQSKEESLHQIYIKLRQVMETTFFTGYKQVLEARQADHVAWKDIDPFLTMEEQRKWVYMLEEGESKEIKTWMYEEFFNLEPPYPEPGLLRTRLTSILAQIRRFMIRNGLDSHECEDSYKKTFDKILYGPVLYRIVQDMFLFCNELIQSTERTGNIKRKDVVESAISYMEEHFTDPAIDLVQVAGHVDLSASYLSHLLSKNYQRSFREMLLSIRLQKAKKLLVSSDESIQNISNSTGFNNPNYFSRVFKKHTGKTPKVYRRSH
ncbi:YesN/AraC family two-component response regulator [Geomicrobium halophilum]|uniref:YesN/AraC family two-component response regulator n=1 Tax=Geomicrobium halophilum TaxID=549000 RepID=A0A841PX13_9BACL|nr:helix-turn-helix domain-containing protein [Geomicrobium halophilum]MBB6448602.1 YesN/AraC family two-component response regulator [Geomicrobium halophilum]